MTAKASQQNDNQCITNVTSVPEDCLIECQGIYTDVQYTRVEKTNKFGFEFERYENYKRGFQIEVEYPDTLAGEILFFKQEW